MEDGISLSWEPHHTIQDTPRNTKDPCQVHLIKRHEEADEVSPDRDSGNDVIKTNLERKRVLY